MSRVTTPRAASGGGPLAFVLVKAFGDLTVTAAVLRRLAPDARQQCALLVSPHLLDLSRVLDPGCQVHCLPIGNGLPPLFDLKRHRPGVIVSSALTLRRTLATAAPSTMLVFDRLSWRERFIVGRRCALPIGEDLAPNVYTAHEMFLQREGIGATLSPTPDVFALPVTSRRIGIFPFSRVAAKNVPFTLVESIARQCRTHGFEPIVLLLEGEEFPSLPGVPVERLARRFDALSQGISSVAAVVAADSLPAHLAEYNGRAAFVASPVENAHYLPPTTFAGHHWGLFTQPDELGQRLARFLHSLS